jgi:organic hydroperoxide reductase OsmC/OhrA
MKEHTYQLRVEWTGNDGDGTKTYRSYRRDHIIEADGKPPIAGSSDPAFRGDKTRYNPEEFLVAALSTCHMLSYLHLCAVNNINVVGYADQPSGVMKENADGSGSFVQVTLKPTVTVSPGDDHAKARELHHRAHELCFIANSVNFSVTCEPDVM